MAQTIGIPKVTVLMPVYNGEKYLWEAINSILKQTYTDFEVLIINDGSIDNSVSIIESFNDARIWLIHNEKNIGLVESLNRGISLSRGEYVARMDCDDISLPQRLEKQVGFLDNNKEVSVVASHIRLMNADDELTGYWKNDIRTNTRKEIRNALPKYVCIAHPSVLIRRNIFDKYKYRKVQKNVEDWDIWMRMAADGIVIDKINEVLLNYRIHFESVTMLQTNGRVSQKKTVKCKQKFLSYQLSKVKINAFFLEVLYSWLRGIGRYWKLYIIPDWLRIIKRILTLNPIRAFSGYVKLKKYFVSHSHNLIFFFPYTHVGGAERVHFEIVSCFKDEYPLVLFTGFSESEAFLKSFEKSAEVFNIPHTLNYPVISGKSKKLIATFINRQTKAATFGCNSLYYYELLDLLNPEIYCVDLKHSFICPPDNVEKALLPKTMRMDKRVFISKKAIENVTKFYFENNIPRSFSERLQYIANYVIVPPEYVKKKTRKKLNVIYVGRGTAEKRVNLIAQIAAECNMENIPVSFQMVGKLKDAIDKTFYPYLYFMGEITNENELNKIYAEADILLITSTTEGFPMTIMEAMANGVVPISTNVGDVPLHLANHQTGFVTSSNEAEVVVSEMVNVIRTLGEDRKLLETISQNAHEYAKNNFSETRFINSYRNLFGIR